VERKTRAPGPDWLACLQVFCAAASDDISPAKTLKSKVWASIQGELHVKAGKPLYKQFGLQTKGGGCTIPQLPDGAGIQ
jgi:hypothetical protein